MPGQHGRSLLQPRMRTARDKAKARRYHVSGATVQADQPRLPRGRLRAPIPIEDVRARPDRFRPQTQVVGRKAPRDRFLPRIPTAEGERRGRSRATLLLVSERGTRTREGHPKRQKAERPRRPSTPPPSFPHPVGLLCSLVASRSSSWPFWLAASLSFEGYSPLQRVRRLKTARR